MAIYLTPPSILHQTVHLPASKSISNRALLIDALCRRGHGMADSSRREGVHNLSDCDDTRAMQRALTTAAGPIDIGAAGTAMRFMTAYLAVTPGTCVITGSERMQHRPIGVLVEALRGLGARIEYVGQEAFPPLRINSFKICQKLQNPFQRPGPMQPRQLKRNHSRCEGQGRPEACPAGFL